jgi:dihydropteroate synthase
VRLRRERIAAASTYRVRPLAPLGGDLARDAVAAGRALPLLGTERAFAFVELLARDGSQEKGLAGEVMSLGEVRAWSIATGRGTALEEQLEFLSRGRPDWAGLSLTHPLVMGIVNVTPDSFSDGGRFAAATDAVTQGIALLEAGADILDVGGESTRPGASPVDPAEEIRRVEPVVRALAARGAVVSIDTRHAATMRAALAAGARIINDVTALTGDRDSLDVAARGGAPVILMHMRGEPRTMQDDPVYECAPLDVLEYLERRIRACEAVGIPRERIVVDPGIGFGKRLRHNLQILHRLSLLHLTGCGVLLGASRKSFISNSSGRNPPPEGRLAGSLAAALGGLDQGVQIFRVHDVAETKQAIEVWQGVTAAN